jgi:hypothetical protein
MLPEEDRERLLHMRDAAQEAAAFVEGVAKDVFTVDLPALAFTLNRLLTTE